jgi:hypothetical protein
LTRIDTTADDSPPRWRRYGLRFVWLLLFVVLVAGGRAWFLSSQNSSALKKAIDATTAADPRWRIEDIVSDWPVVADEENSALVVVAGNNLIDQSKKSIPNADESDEPPPANCLMNDTQLKRLAADLAPYQRAIAEYRKIASLPAGSFPMVGLPDVTLFLTRATPYRQPSIALRYDLSDRLNAGDDAAATIALKAALNVPRSIGDEAFAVTVVVRNATVRTAIDGIERWLGMSEPSEADLDVVQRMLDREIGEPLLVRFARAERASAFFQTNHVLATIPTPTNPWDAAQQAFGMVFTAPGFIAEQLTAILTHMNAFVAIAQLPDHQMHGPIKQWQTTANKAPVLMKLMVPAVVKVAESIQKTRARAQCALVGVAAERFRKQHGHWPTSLDELVSTKLLSVIPIDPFDGQPLHWKIVSDGRVIYPICNDKSIDAPGTDRTSRNDRTDIVFHLFDADKRRQPPKPPKAKAPAAAEPAG